MTPSERLKLWRAANAHLLNQRHAPREPPKPHENFADWLDRQPDARKERNRKAIADFMARHRPG